MRYGRVVGKRVKGKRIKWTPACDASKDENRKKGVNHYCQKGVCPWMKIKGTFPDAK